jgi:hypothetical protein
MVITVSHGTEIRKHEDFVKNLGDDERIYGILSIRCLTHDCNTVQNCVWYH